MLTSGHPEHNTGRVCLLCLSSETLEDLSPLHTQIGLVVFAGDAYLAIKFHTKTGRRFGGVYYSLGF